MRLQNLTVDQYKDYAKKCVANWKKFESFSWSDKTDDPDNYYIHYTSHRDSDLLDRANEQVILEHFAAKFKRTENLNWQTERHSHWAFGYASCLTVRVYKRNGKMTREFKELVRIMDYILNDYPILDESVYDEFVVKATRENIDFEAYSLKNKHELPETWIDDVIDYWYVNKSEKLYNRDDTGGWLSSEDIEIALKEKGIIT